tara:strand:+ start:10842 stop:11456 length:615 start_codon:yes stop_codon:yes gene_type:complete
MFLGFKKYLFFIGVSVLMAGCTTSQQATNGQQNGEVETPATPVTGSNTKNTEKANEEAVNSIKITYKNRNTDLVLSLNPNKENFFLDFKGMSPAEKDTIIIADSTLIKKRATDIQALLAAFRQAQDLFYLGEYNEALIKINESLRIQETADAYGLKGTIYFMLNRKSATRENWNKAVQLNPNILIPNIPELEDIIKDIKGGPEQ